MKYNNTHNNGQVMIVTIIMMGGVLLSAAAIAGLLMIFQIRESNDSVNSARAFFAADAALEYQTYNQLWAGQSFPMFRFDDVGLSATSSVEADAGGGFIITAEGYSGRSVRSLESVFQ